MSRERIALSHAVRRRSEAIEFQVDSGNIRDLMAERLPDYETQRANLLTWLAHKADADDDGRVTSWDYEEFMVVAGSASEAGVREHVEEFKSEGLITHEEDKIAGIDMHTTRLTAAGRREARKLAETFTSHAIDFDLFISHASEDKESFVNELVRELQLLGVRVWFDSFTLMIGDSLRRSIDRGLVRSRFGVVVLSAAFFEKEWPQRELDGLTALEIGGRPRVLPLWHNLTRSDIARYSPMLADRMALTTALGPREIAAKLLERLKN